jgi:hypothetical protein
MTNFSDALPLLSALLLLVPLLSLSVLASLSAGVELQPLSSVAVTATAARAPAVVLFRVRDDCITSPLKNASGRTFSAALPPSWRLVFVAKCAVDECCKGHYRNFDSVASSASKMSYDRDEEQSFRPILIAMTRRKGLDHYEFNRAE